MGAIYRREMSSFFTSGLGYVFLTVFYAFSGYFFYNDVILSGMSDTSPMFVSMFIIFIFLIPVLTMRLISEEKKNRTDQGLLTAPISLWELVMGKYLAAFTLFTIAEAVIFVYAVILNYLGEVVWQTLLGNFFAMLILGGAFIAVGLFVSCLTENQMTAAIVSFVVMLILYMYDDLILTRVSTISMKGLCFIVYFLVFFAVAYFICNFFIKSTGTRLVVSAAAAAGIAALMDKLLNALFFSDSVEKAADKVGGKIIDVLTALSFRTRYMEFTKGIFSMSSILFFISTAFLFNFLTVRVLEKKRWG